MNAFCRHVSMFSVLAVLSSVFSVCCGYVAADAPGIGVAFFENARPNCPAPEGFDATDWEWRPLYVSNSGSYDVQQNPNLIAKPFHWQSRVAWKDHTGGCPWLNSGNFEHGGLPSGVWRRYSETLYHQVNGSAIPNPDAVAGYQPGDYYYNRYGAGGTMPSSQLPSNWYLDPMKRWLVWSALTSCDGMSNWGMYQDISQLYYFDKWEGGAAKTMGCGARIGAGGASMFAALVVAEYALTIAYDQQVQALNEEVEAYRAAQMPSEHDYYGIDDPSLGRRIVVRRKVPNFSIPSGCDSSIAPTRDSQGSVGIRTPEVTAPQQFTASDFKSVTFNESFTTASVPFQFSIEPSCQSGTPTSEFSGRFILRLHDCQGAWHEFPIAGVKDGQWISPWSYVDDRDAQSGWNSTENNANSVSTDFATSGTDKAAIAWSGQVIVRAYDLGVSHFDKMEIKATVSARGAAAGETTRVRSWLSVQPAFTRNIAEAGPWASTQPGQSITFSADTGLVPSNASSTVYTWTLPDGSTHSGESVSYTFDSAGIYDVKLRVDPTVPEAAPNAYLFNDSAGGFSYDICRVAVGQASNPVQSSDSGVLDFESVTVTASPTEITVDFTTNQPSTAEVNWRTFPPWFVGPPAPSQAGTVSDANLAQHHTVVVPAPDHDAYYLQIKAFPEGSGGVIAYYDGEEWWAVFRPASNAGSVVLSSDTAPVSFSAPTFGGAPGEAHITWDTDVPTTTRVQCTDSSGDYYDGSYTTGHDVTITGLTPGQSYGFWLSGIPQSSTGSVYLRSGGVDIDWSYVVEQYYDSGSRAGESHPLDYLTAVSEPDGALRVEAVLGQSGRIRLKHRPYGSEDWTTGSWTDASGTREWSLALSPGPYELVVDWEMPNGDVMSSRPQAVVHEQVQQQAVGRITAVVVRADNRQHLPGIGVCVDSWTNAGFVGETDANGRIVFDEVPAGEHTVHASETGYGSTSQTVTVLDDHAHLVELWLPMKSTVYGSVKLAEQHRAAHPHPPQRPYNGGDGFYYVNGVTVFAIPGGPSVQTGKHEQVHAFDPTMQENGSYIFENLTPGAHTLNVSLDGWTSVPQSVNITQPGQEIRRDFVIQPAGDQQQDDQDQGGGQQGRQVKVQASNYRPHGCSRIIGWDWLRRPGAMVTVYFDGSEFEGCDPSRVRLHVSALCTDRSSGGAGYTTNLTFHMYAGSVSHACRVKMENPFGAPNPNLTTGEGYRIRGESTLLPGNLIEQAISTGELKAVIAWPADLSQGADRHVAFRKDSLTLASD